MSSPKLANKQSLAKLTVGAILSVFLLTQCIAAFSFKGIVFPQTVEQNQEPKGEAKPMQVGYTRPDVIFGHVHMTMTGGSTLNGMLASRYENVCGNKGNSYDYFQHNERVRKQGKSWALNRIAGDRFSVCLEAGTAA